MHFDLDTDYFVPFYLTGEWNKPPECSYFSCKAKQCLVLGLVCSFLEAWEACYTVRLSFPLEHGDSWSSSERELYLGTCITHPGHCLFPPR